MKKISKSKFSSVILAIMLYFLAQNLKNSPSIPAISKIIVSLKNILSSLKFYKDLFYTIEIVLLGVIVSFLAGFLIAIICSLSEAANNLIMPIVNATKNIPSIALFPLFIVLMGIGNMPRIFVIVWNSLYPIISSTALGLNSVDRDIIEAGMNCGASKWQLYKYIKIPLSTINILEGLKISIGNGFIAIVVAEMLGATKGLGYMILWSANAFKYSDMYAYILIIALVGFSINVVIEKFIKYIKRRIFYD